MKSNVLYLKTYAVSASIYFICSALNVAVELSLSNSSWNTSSQTYLTALKSRSVSAARGASDRLRPWLETDMCSRIRFSVCTCRLVCYSKARVAQVSPRAEERRLYTSLHRAHPLVVTACTGRFVFWFFLLFFFFPPTGPQPS